jgi:hypothetical protein
MYVIVSTARRRVRVTETGTFFCLRCNADSGYQLREWRESAPLLILTILAPYDQFVLCTTCETAFDVECLDESSTAELHELEIDVPDFTRKVLRSRVPHDLASYVGRDSLDQAQAQGPTQWNPEAVGRRTLSAHSSFRKH